MRENFELRQRVVAQPADAPLISGSSHGVVFDQRRGRHVQKAKVRRVQRAFHRLRPVALLQALGDEAVRGRDDAKFELRQLGRLVLWRPQIGPHQVAKFARGVGLDADFAVVIGAFGHIGQFHTLAGHVVFPAVVDAANSAIFIAAKKQIRTPMRALGLDQADAALCVAKRQQLFAQQLYADRRAIGFRQFV